jgi:hypothetical protein
LPIQNQGKYGQKGKAQTKLVDTQTSQSLAQHRGTCLTDQPSVVQQQDSLEFVGQTKETKPTLMRPVSNPTKRHACPTSIRSTKRVRRQP